VSTPASQVMVLLKRQATEQPRDSGRISDKCARHLGVEAMYALSESVHTISGAFASGSTSSILLPASPERLTRAIQLVEEEERECGQDSPMEAVDLFQ